MTWFIEWSLGPLFHFGVLRRPRSVVLGIPQVADASSAITNCLPRAHSSRWRGGGCHFMEKPWLCYNIYHGFIRLIWLMNMVITMVVWNMLILPIPYGTWLLQYCQYNVPYYHVQYWKIATASISLISSCKNLYMSQVNMIICLRVYCNIFTFNN